MRNKNSSSTLFIDITVVVCQRTLQTTWWAFSLLWRLDTMFIFFVCYHIFLNDWLLVSDIKTVDTQIANYEILTFYSQLLAWSRELQDFFILSSCLLYPSNLRPIILFMVGRLCSRLEHNGWMVHAKLYCL